MLSKVLASVARAATLNDLISNIDDHDADWQLGDDQISGGQIPGEIEPAKYYWEIVANNLSKAGWSWGRIGSDRCMGRSDFLLFGTPARLVFACPGVGGSWASLNILVEK
jgi:hypothetical protein